MTWTPPNNDIRKKYEGLFTIPRTSGGVEAFVNATPEEKLEIFFALADYYKWFLLKQIPREEQIDLLTKCSHKIRNRMIVSRADNPESYLDHVHKVFPDVFNRKWEDIEPSILIDANGFIQEYNAAINESDTMGYPGKQRALYRADVCFSALKELSRRATEGRLTGKEMTPVEVKKVEPTVIKSDLGEINDTQIQGIYLILTDQLKELKSIPLVKEDYTYESNYLFSPNAFIKREMRRVRDLQTVIIAELKSRGLEIPTSPDQIKTSLFDSKSFWIILILVVIIIVVIIKKRKK